MTFLLGIPCQSRRIFCRISVITLFFPPWICAPASGKLNLDAEAGIHCFSTPSGHYQYCRMPMAKLTLQLMAPSRNCALHVLSPRKHPHLTRFLTMISTTAQTAIDPTWQKSSITLESGDDSDIPKVPSLHITPSGTVLYKSKPHLQAKHETVSFSIHQLVISKLM
ncbi:hypothetical protein GWK47_048839 [Chionoecetes opilio]|uniref:Uncharacterized protein n=1 Tax=Chionoecetes opilio TaxID=41210 RepID=A0A8J4Y409_CHIOP|nr:hypothetical protein GWK47_048839 [Chionoecetes opilio]